MAYRLHRLTAHLSDPLTYDPPSREELFEILNEMERSRKFADMLFLSIVGGGNTVTFSEEDLDTVADLRSPSLERDDAST